MMTKLQDLLPRLAVRLRNCPANMVALGLRQGFRQWALDSRAWRDTITQSLSAAKQTYDLQPAFEAEVWAVMEDGVRVLTQADASAQRSGRALSRSEFELTTAGAPLGNRDNDIEAEKADAANASGTTKLYLRDAPAANLVRLDVDVILIPTLATKLDAPLALLNHHAEGIVCAALAWLYSQPGKPWFSVSSYQIESAAANDRATMAFVDAERGGTNDPLLQCPPIVV